MRRLVSIALFAVLSIGVARATPVGGPIVTIVKKVRPGVVKITAVTGNAGALGTGFIVSQSGDVLTNNHVVMVNDKEADVIAVQLADGRRLRGKIVARDPRTDIALVSIPNDRITPLVLGNSDDVEVGEEVVAIGQPRGLEFSVTSGIVSAKNRRDFNFGGADTYVDFIQTDAAINHGNSGGPLFNMRGEVIGINSAVRSDGQNLGFVIPINVAKRIASDLRKYGKVQRGWLGFSVKPPPAATDPLATREGAIVDAVVAGSPAESAGLKPGDLVLHFDRTKVEDEQHLRWLCADSGIGRHVVLGIKRGGKTKELKLVSVPQPER